MTKKILIIDDNEQDRKIMKRFLNEAGYQEIVFAEEGETGVEKANIEKPDLIIIDTVLPGIDGFEVCLRIRATEGIETSKIIIITGTIDAVDALRARRVGANDYCVKTNDSSYLIEAVRKLI